MCKNQGFFNVHCYMETCNLTTFWWSTYLDITFTIPLQFNVNNAVPKANPLALSGANLHVPKALSLPSNHPVISAGV